MERMVRFGVKRMWFKFKFCYWDLSEFEYINFFKIEVFKNKISILLFNVKVKIF